jgi:hypothetical protein
MEAVMHTEKKKNALARESTTMPITSNAYIKIHVSVLGIQLHSVTFVGVTVVLNIQFHSVIFVGVIVATSMSRNCAAVSLVTEPVMLEAIPLTSKDLRSSTLVLSRTFKNVFKNQYTTQILGSLISYSLIRYRVLTCIVIKQVHTATAIYVPVHMKRIKIE